MGLAKGTKLKPIRQREVDKMVELYKEGWAIRPIAGHLHRSYGSVHRLLRKSGVEMRESGWPKR